MNLRNLLKEIQRVTEDVHKLLPFSDFHRLPAVTWQLIMGFLTVRDVLHLEVTCKSTRKALRRSNPLWLRQWASLFVYHRQRYRRDDLYESPLHRPLSPEPEESLEKRHQLRAERRRRNHVEDVCEAKQKAETERAICKNDVVFWEQSKFEFSTMRYKRGLLKDNIYCLNVFRFPDD